MRPKGIYHNCNNVIPTESSDNIFNRYPYIPHTVMYENKHLETFIALAASHISTMLRPMYS